MDWELELCRPIDLQRVHLAEFEFRDTTLNIGEFVLGISGHLPGPEGLLEGVVR